MENQNTQVDENVSNDKAKAPMPKWVIFIIVVAFLSGIFFAIAGFLKS